MMCVSSSRVELASLEAHMCASCRPAPLPHLLSSVSGPLQGPGLSDKRLPAQARLSQWLRIGLHSGNLLPSWDGNRLARAHSYANRSGFPSSLHSSLCLESPLSLWPLTVVECRPFTRVPVGKGSTQANPVPTLDHRLCRAGQSAPQRLIPQEGQPEESSLRC